MASELFTPLLILLLLLLLCSPSSPTCLDKRKESIVAVSESPSGPQRTIGQLVSDTSSTLSQAHYAKHVLRKVTIQDRRRTQDWRGELSLCAASLGSPLYWIQLKVLWCVYESLNKAPGHRDQDYICPDCVLVEIDRDRDIFDII